MDNLSKEKFLKIGQVAKKLDISVELIRAYENEGLFIPHRTPSGQRLFNESDVDWLVCIRRLINEQGLNIEGIRRLLALIPCWELRPCSEKERKECPAYIGAIKPCWMLKEILPLHCTENECRNCSVYQGAIKCENLKALLYGSKNKMKKCDL